MLPVRLMQLNSLIDEYESYFMNGGIQQSYSDLRDLVEEIGDRKFSNMAEIGVADGATLWLYSQLFGAPKAHITLVDNDWRAVTARVVMALEGMEFTFKIHIAQSDTVKIDGPLDFLHIDGDHRYEYVKYDYDTHGTKVVPGGVIIIHDTTLIEGPLRLKHALEHMGVAMKNFNGTDTMCNCFGPDRQNPQKRAFGTTVIWK